MGSFYVKTKKLLFLENRKIPCRDGIFFKMTRKRFFTEDVSIYPTRYNIICITYSYLSYILYLRQKLVLNDLSFYAVLLNRPKENNVE